MDYFLGILRISIMRFLYFLNKSKSFLPSIFFLTNFRYEIHIILKCLMIFLYFYLLLKDFLILLNIFIYY